MTMMTILMMMTTMMTTITTTTTRMTTTMRISQLWDLIEAWGFYKDINDILDTIINNDDDDDDIIVSILWVLCRSITMQNLKLLA